jgi:hypothetical protein
MSIRSVGIVICLFFVCASAGFAQAPPRASFYGARIFSAGTLPVSVAVGDFNGDGKPDMAVTNLHDKTVSVLLGNGDGTFQAAVDYSTAGGYPISIAVGDFNGDGKLDLAVANYASSTVSVFNGRGDGTFYLGAYLTVGTNPYSIAVGDFNGDGKPDLVTANSSGSVSVLINVGSGFPPVAVTYPAGTSPYSRGWHVPDTGELRRGDESNGYRGGGLERRQ